MRAKDLTPKAWEHQLDVASGLVPKFDYTLVDTLTEKQKVVLSMVGSGLNLYQVAQLLRRSYSAVRDLRRDAMKKIKVENVEQAVRFAVEAGLVTRRECGVWVQPAWVAKILSIADERPPAGGKQAPRPSRASS